MKISFILSLILILSPALLYGTHLRAGEITVEQINCSREFLITITVYTNTKSSVLFGGKDEWLDFGDGQRVGVPITNNTPRPDLGEGVGMARFTVRHIYRNDKRYVISYSEQNRNEGVLNMGNSGNTAFYIETEIVIDSSLGCNISTPVLQVPPIDYGCTGATWFHNPGAFDADGDSLSYEIVTPFLNREKAVADYKNPNDPAFYLNYSKGNEMGTGVPVFAINAVDGTITWDAPGTAGEYNIAFIIREWKRSNEGRRLPIGFVRRDMQIVIGDCTNKRPDLIAPEDVCVEAGTTINATVFGIDADGDEVKLEVFSEVFNRVNLQSPATYTPDPATYQPSLPPAQLKVQWQTSCEHIREQHYQVVLKITDKSPSGFNLVTFKTWFIRVVAPQPEWINAIPDFSQRSVTLLWEEYSCKNAESMQIWRKVGGLDFVPDFCQTGMPANLGYTLINEFAIKDRSGNQQTAYVDTNNGKGLAEGAVYCYRLVAAFSHPKGGKSYVSRELCLPPMPAVTPVITNVSVLKTGKDDGKINVKWVQPFDLEGGLFQEPFQYTIFRAEGFDGDVFIPLSITDDEEPFEIIDDNINTEDKVYTYRILALDANSDTIGISSMASSVRLQAQSQLNKIQLTWKAEVPWSNHVKEFNHKIYRGSEGSTAPEDFELIATVDVLTSGFKYTDEGQHNNVPLEQGKKYCYLIETAGVYGAVNSILKDKEPLLNFSQVACTTPGDENPPCKPDVPLAHEPLNCDDYRAQTETCSNHIAISNTITWRKSTQYCDVDIFAYKIYYSPVRNGAFSPLTTEAGSFILVRDTFFIHNGLTSYAGCYKIAAIDHSGNESEVSEEVCFDNCPYYELPNVFTPNNDKCNDVFSAYSSRDIIIEGEENVCGNPSIQAKARCARFVDGVIFRVYNRWGKQVYYYKSGSESTIYIDWDGRASDGSELGSGIYYYVANVTFKTVDPSQNHQTIKGWVNLVREASP